MNIHLQKICVSTDFSDAAQQALHYGAALAQKFSAQLHVLHVLEDAHAAVTHPDFTTDGEIASAYFNQMEEAATGEKSPVGAEQTEIHDFLRSMQTGVTEHFNQLTADPWWKSVDLIRSVRYGSPVEQICRYALKSSIDLLILGTHGRRGLSHLLIGSVAERVVRSAPCPVLTVREHERNFVAPE